ncbi:hypothetical protein DOY81_006602 [Sarcophaga bullata]|nr:hypothetical protein DOY81_006602 [Sarcophaga bullata]
MYFALEDTNIVGPCYFTQEEKSNHINLLLLENGEKCHYAWIKNIFRYQFQSDYSVFLFQRRLTTTMATDLNRKMPASIYPQIVVHNSVPFQL